MESVTLNFPIQVLLTTYVKSDKAYFIKYCGLYFLHFRDTRISLEEPSILQSLPGTFKLSSTANTSSETIE